MQNGKVEERGLSVDLGFGAVETMLDRHTSEHSATRFVLSSKRGLGRHLVPEVQIPPGRCQAVIIHW